MIKQGDAYNLIVALAVDEAAPDLNAIEKIEFAIGSLRKEYPTEVAYDSSLGVFLFPLTQQETFAIRAQEQRVQTRVKFTSGEVKGSDISYVDVGESISKAVL